MKKFLLSIVAATMCMTVAAQETSRFFTAPTDGYRGFAGLNVFTGLGNEPFDRFAITTIHGFQADQLFVGIGTSMQFVTNSNDGYYDENDVYHYSYDNNDPEFMMPFFINANYEMPSAGRVAPFGDLKLGYSVGDVCGLYVLPSVGIRLAHISLWCGYNLMQDKKITGDDNKKTLTNYHSIAFGVTLDWGARNKN